MKLHLTGMSPRTASQQTRERITFAGLLARVLGIEGHLVSRATSTSKDSDFVIVGVASALSPGATYGLVGLAAIGHAIENDIPLLLLADDPDLTKIKSGAASAVRDHRRLFSDYLMSKRIKVSREITEQQRKQIMRAVRMLASDHWPPVLLPMHTWGMGTEAMLAKRLGVETSVIPLDVTAAMGAAHNVIPRPPGSRAQMWFTERHYSSITLAQERVRWPVIPVDSGTMELPEQVYAAAKGVHQGLAGSCAGWWTPIPRYVAQAGTVYLMDPSDQALVGPNSPYYLTPDYVEMLSDDDHGALVEQQRDYLEENTWSLEQLLSRLEELTGLTSSFSMPDTATSTT